MNREEAIQELALLLAKNRTGGSVYMDGRHNPRPTEIQTARQFIEALEYSGWVQMRGGVDT